MLAENLDIIILTIIIALLFLIFILATLKEFAESAKTPFKGGKERGVRADLIELVGKIFSDETIEPEEKKILLKKMSENLTSIEDEKQKK